MTPSSLYYPSSEELDNCAREPIHQTTLVQSFGFVVCCDLATATITHVSDNIGQHLGVVAQRLIGCNLCDLIGEPIAQTLAHLQAVQPGSPRPVAFGFVPPASAEHRFEVVAHRSGQTVMIEAAPYTGVDTEFNYRHQLEAVVNSLGTLQRQHTLSDFLGACAKEIRLLADYHRVIIYRFLPDWSGEVIAESHVASTQERFLGLRFPASDIPAQARELYRVNLLRVIADVDAPPAMLLGAADAGPLDQTHGVMRSPSPMHLRYLQNMGVRATLTISLLKDGALWGMVSCHHNQPKAPPEQLRKVTQLLCALVAETATARLDAVQLNERTTKSLVLKHAMAALSGQLQNSKDFPAEADAALADISSALNAQAHGLMISGKWMGAPAVPPDLLAFLLRQGRTLPPGGVYTTTSLAAEGGVAVEHWQPWAGAMLLRLPAVVDSYLVMLRKELVQQIQWAGAPVKTQAVLPDGMRVLGPRHSFERWTQLVQGQCDLWTERELAACELLVKDLGEAYLTYSSQAMQAELRLLGACMERLNDMVVVTDAISVDEPGPRIVYVNDSFEAITGYRRDEVLGRSPRLLQGPQTDRAQLDRIRKSLQEWKPITVEIINYKKSGEPFWVEISMAPIADSKGWFTHWVAIERDISARKRAEQDIQKLVFYDVITGLPNRRMLMDRLHIATSASARNGHNGAVLFIDMDGFKDLNDTAGHHVGDELLMKVARRLRAVVRQGDTVARLGGDEFVVLLEDLGPDLDEAASTARGIADKLIAELARTYRLSDRFFDCSASLGLALFHDQGRAHSVDELMKQADFAMYQAKAAGKNTWRFFDPLTQAQVLARFKLGEDLKEAMVKQHLNLYYQPIFNRNQEVVGAEALLRWHHEQRGWVSPTEFIPVAEQAGLILPLGEWVLTQACQQLARWEDMDAPSRWTLAVNVSAKQIRQPDFVDTVKRVVAATGCSPYRLKLELTESLLQHDVAATAEKMQILRLMGIEFSIDDFGTGYSSLAYLQRLPVSVLKIDRSFVKDIGESDSAAAICKTVLMLGTTLSMAVVAEGVETQAQFDFLYTFGCDRFQGFLFSKALPLQELEDAYAYA